KSGPGRPFSRSKLVVCRGWKLERRPRTPYQACVKTKLDRLPWRKEKFWSVIPQTKFSITEFGVYCFKGPKLLSLKEGRLINHRQDWAGDQVPRLIQVRRIDRLNVEDVLRVVGAANVKVRIVLKRQADQIGDRILRSIAQIFSLLGISRR